jgi:hypothetical protein
VNVQNSYLSNTTSSPILASMTFLAFASPSIRNTYIAFFESQELFRTSSSTSSAAISAGILDLCDNIYHLRYVSGYPVLDERLVLFRHRVYSSLWS